MKKNRINPIEQHFEKVILVGVSAVLLGVVSMQFLTEPNAVKVGNSADPVPPGDVFKVIEPEADALLAEIRNTSPRLPEVPEQDVAQRFENARTLDSQSLSFANFGTGVEIEGSELVDSGTELAATTYTMPALPVPQTVVAATHRAAIDPIVALTRDDLKPYLPEQQPFDALAVSIEGSVSGASLRESLETDPDGDGPESPLPLMWWRGNVHLLGVEVQREELTTGGWTNPTVIAGMTSAEFDALELAREPDIAADDLGDIAAEAQEYIRDLVQPRFPRKVAGPDWVRPSELVIDEGLSEEDRQIALHTRRLEQVRRAIAAAEAERAELGGGGGGQEYDERARRGGGESGGQATDPNQRRRDSLQRQLDSHRRNEQRILDDLAELGVFPDQDENDIDDTRPEETPIPPILDAEDLPVWVHDFTAEPGKTYRYRMRVVLNNPLYARGLYLSDAQKDAADSATLEGEWSAWSSDVDVESDRQFFVVSASEDDRLGSGPRAAVEVYQFYYGYWREATATLSPGDTIHARTRLPDNLLIWDPEVLRDLGQLPRPGQRRADPGGMDPRDPRNNPGGLNERELRQMERQGGNRAFQPQAGRGEDAPLPEGAEPGPESLDLEVPAMLLDVARIPGEDNVFQAILRTSDGSVITRDATDRSTLLYQRLAQNAREGEEAGRPEPDPNDEPRRPQNQDRREFEDPGTIPGG